MWSDMTAVGELCNRHNKHFLTIIILGSYMEYVHEPPHSKTICAYADFNFCIYSAIRVRPFHSAHVCPSLLSTGKTSVLLLLTISIA